MKKSIGIYCLLFIFFGCEETDISSETAIVEEPPVVVIPPFVDDEIVISPKETKEPFIELIDTGFEAVLIIYGIDSDNQLNGKVAKSDIEGVTHIGSVDGEIPPEVHARNRYIRNMYGGNHPPIEVMDDIKHFPKLKSIKGITGSINHMDLTQNSELESIYLSVPRFKSLDVRGLKKLKEVTFGGYVNLNPGEILLGNNVDLEKFLCFGHSEYLDLSQAPNLTFFHYYSMHPGLKQDNLDLSKNKKLEHIGGYGIKKPIIISKETDGKIKSGECKLILSESFLQVED
jgi:hypothetical protein